MMENTLEVQLSALDVSVDEARVYLSLVEIGRAFVSVLAKRADVPRVNCYHLLDGLERKGLVSVSIHKGKKMYQANAPEVLVKQQLERLRVAEKLLPELKQLSRARPSPVAIRPIEGEAGVRSVFEASLETAGEILAYSNVDSLKQVLKEYLHYYAEERSRRRIKSRLISPYTTNAKHFLDTYYPHDQKRELTEIAFVDAAEFPFESEVYIFGSSVATFTTNQKHLLGVVVTSEQLAQTYRSIFNLSWLGATSFLLG